MADPVSEGAWSFLAVAEGDRQHQGNQGYDDEPSRYYSWDSIVPNHEKPQVGDVCIVRDSEGVIGVSQIDVIERRENVKKIRKRCTDCGSTALKARSKMRPVYRCSNCKSEFDDPEEELLHVTKYRADYARSWFPMLGAVTAEELESGCYLSHSKQQAIRAVDPTALRRLLTERQVLIAREWWEDGGAVEPPDIPGGRLPRTVLGRIGQGEFRRRLFKRFGAVCAFTGPQPPDSLHAAHVTPYATDPRHELAGGLLLRADLHSLFDHGLISIDPDLIVRIDSSLREYRDLSRLDGSKLKINSADPYLADLKKLLEDRAAARTDG